MVHDEAVTVETTSARTRVHTLLVDAGLCLRTLRADNTLWLADRWYAAVAGQARAGGGMLCCDQTSRVGSAGRRVARVVRVTHIHSDWVVWNHKVWFIDLRTTLTKANTANFMR